MLEIVGVEFRHAGCNSRSMHERPPPVRREQAPLPEHRLPGLQTLVQISISRTLSNRILIGAGLMAALLTTTGCPGGDDKGETGDTDDSVANNDADGDGFALHEDCNDNDAGDYPDELGSCTGTPAAPVDLGAAGGFVILAKTGISTVPGSAITGNIGLSPAAATYITGFSLTADSTNEFSTSPQVTGRVYAADYEVPTPANLTTAVGAMETAFTDAAGRAADYTELAAGDIGGLTLEPGVYKWGTGLLIPTDVTLQGSATDVWIFEIAQDLTMASATRVVLSGGAVPENIFWQVSGLVSLGTTAHLEGIVLVQTAATLATGASVNGRLLAQTEVTLDGSTVTKPAR